MASHIPLIARLQSFFHIPLDLIKEFEEHVLNVPTLYANIISGKTFDLSDGSTSNEIKLYGCLALIGSYYGFSSVEYLNVYNNIFKYQLSDPHWLGYIVDQLQRDHSVKYIPPQSYEDDTYRIKNEFKAILVGDWGTGNSNATFLVKEAAKLSPDYFIHLGDVYYTGTVDEQNLNYVTPLQKYLPHTQIFSVPGNHDYYSGSQGYQWACSQFGQKHSYFILENDHIQIHGIDAAMKNIDPLNTEEASHLNADEVRWHLEHIKDTNKHVIMCEHFPLFSYNSTISGDCLDLDQYAALAPCIDKVTAWFWGHQHQFQLYKPYTFPNGEVLQKARLIGAGSFNTDSNLDLLYTQNKYSGKYPVPELVEGDEWHTQYNGETISNSFGVLEGKMVDGKYVLSMTYYQIPTPDVGVYETAVVCYQEILN